LRRVCRPSKAQLCFVHQDCEACNAGRGSNLTLGGVVECDASVMDDAGAFGAVAAVPGKICPVVAATSAYCCTATAVCSLQRGLAVVAAKDRADVLHLPSDVRVAAVLLPTLADCIIDRCAAGVANPIRAACRLAAEGRQPLSLGRVCPMCALLLPLASSAHDEHSVHQGYC
jgi:Asparaginase